MPPDLPGTLQSYLDAERITYKAITNHNQARKTEHSLASLDEQTEWFLANLATQWNSGRSRPEQPAIQITPANRGENVSVAVAIQREVDIVCHRVSETDFNRRSFNAFMEELIGHDISNPAPNLWIILANCRIHQDLDLGDQLETTGRILRFLPPENPMFNPIEEVFADLKHSIRTSLSTMMCAEVLDIHDLPWGEKAGARRQLLSRALDIAFQRIGVDQVANHYASTPLGGLLSSWSTRIGKSHLASKK
jgi:hypothetical protein